MTWLPIVDRELRVAARKAGTYWFRFFGALLVLLAWLAFLLGSRNSVAPAELGRNLFDVLGMLALLFCLLAGVFLTADCLSEEKREGTLGLLFLTDLKGYDVVLGKLAATSLHSVYGLLAIFPILALPIMMGGVTGGEFVRVLLALLGALFFSLAAGLLVSALSHGTRQSMSGTLGLILSASLLPIIIYDIGHFIFKSAFIGPVLWLGTTGAYQGAFDSHYGLRRGPWEFWCAWGILMGFSSGLLALAMRALPRVWQEKKPAPAAARPWIKVGGFRFGNTRTRDALRSKLLSLNPYFWLAGRDRLPAILVWSFFGPILPVWFFSVLLTFIGPHGARDDASLCAVLCTVGMHVIFKCLVAAEAGRRLSEDRQSGALEAILATPLSEKDILEGQFQALLRHFKAPMIFIIAANLCVWLAMCSMDDVKYVVTSFTVVGFGGIFILLIDFYSLGWVGMWMALSAPRYRRAVLGALGRVMLLPWLAILLAGFVIEATGGSSPGVANAFFLCWFTLGIMNDLIAAIWAKARLRKQFRRCAGGPGPALRPLSTAR